jgi:WXG100 family type VII secretion target
MSAKAYKTQKNVQRIKEYGGITMSQIRMSPELMRTRSSEVHGQGQMFNEVIQKMRGIINELQTEWEGNASRQFAAQFESLQPSFNSMHRLFEDLSKQLSETARVVEEMDATIASKFKG